ncbi:acetate--CoA ligase family protein [Haloarcula nitratireducens]|uniref:acetate--CoA ligase (ADP-forming) n=1 Tax=Haloarcula nitratireducens TaxID=2487749 RepID=A0AAW4PK41_9EURY|nr:acetate--CoA ligase family protein [Halomicroarcula nitratireducens]MBX0297821.1 acetate--CoA ligase family protein [Halomicroarcula nitratireducens]
MSDLGDLFTPERVAVVGATDREESVGRALMSNLSAFDGKVLPVNPNRETVLGEPCYPRIDAIPDASAIDLAVVAVPASAVIDVVRQVGEAGIRNVVVITAGFSETGERGRQREQELIDVAETYDLNLVGPNCVGLISTPNGLNVTFAQGRPPEGNISLMSQSGAFIAAVLGWAAQHGVGFRHVVSLGNEALLDEVDFIAEWGDDPDTDVILAYLEDIDDGRGFIETARDVTKHTPIVVIKSGRTEAGAEAAASHTGSIAGSDRAYQAGIDQAGVLRAMNIHEVFDYGQVLAGQPLPTRDDVAVVTNGGGPGVLTADAIGESRLTLADFEDDVSAALAELLPEEADVANPLDIIGDADLDRFRRTLDTVLGADTVGSAVVLSVPTALFEFEDLAGVIGDLQERHDKPVVTCLMGGEEADRAADALGEYGIPNYFDPARAVPSLAALADYRDVREREYESPTEFDVDSERAGEILAEAVDRGVDYLGVEAMELLDAYGIPTPASGLAESADDAEAIAEEIGGPVVLKIVSPDIVHKSDIGGVEVGIPIEDVQDTYRTIHKRATDHDPDATILGVHVEELVDPDESTETIVGAKRDPQFGHLVMFGLGGIFVQIFEDTSFRVAPVSEHEAREMTGDIHAAPMLRGARGRTPADLDAVVETIQRISQLVTDFPAITELDINPLVVAPDGVYAIDFRLTIDREMLSTS